MGAAVTSLEGFTRKIRSIAARSDQVLLFRGHGSWRYRLLPSVLREVRYKRNEHIVVRELVASHPEDFAGDTTTLEQLVRVQHYALPSRLLDATWNPLVALYFAAAEKFDVNGEVVVFRVDTSVVKYYDSDTVSCVSNLAHLTTEQKDAIDFAAADFNNQTSIDRLLQFIRVEKPHFRAQIEPNHLRTVWCVKPKQNNRRILAQSGAFLIFGLTAELDTNPVSNIAIERIRINKSSKAQILSELDRVAINESTMFPEIERAASYITKRL